MKVLLVAVRGKSTGKSYSHLGKELKSFGDDCQTLENIWMLRTEQSVADIYAFVKQKVIDPSDQFIVASLDGKWIAYDAPSSDDCFEY